MNAKINNIQKQATKAQRAINQHDQKTALRLLDRLLRKYPNEELSLRVGAALYGKLKAFDQSIICIRKLLTLHSGKFEYLVTLQNMLREIGKENDLVNDLKNFIAKHPKEGKAYHQIAKIYHSNQNFGLAIENFKKALSLNVEAEMANCYFGLALSQVELHCENEGVENLKLCLSLDNNHHQAKFNLATLLNAKGDNDAAIELYDELINSNPKLTEALVRRIYIAKVTEQTKSLLETALKKSKTAIPIDKEKLFYALGKGYDDLKNYQQALNYYREANNYNKLRIGEYKPEIIDRFVNRTINVKSTDTALAIDNDFTPIFIVGHFRSGSTLVEQIISRHSQVAALGEIEFFLQFYHENEDSFWRSLEETNFEKLEHIKNNYLNKIRDLTKSQCYFTDKRPENMRFINLIKLLFPNAKIIITKRNITDNALSIYFQQLNDLSTFANDFQDIITYDKQMNKLIECWSETFEKDIHVIEYEDLVSNYESSVKSLIDFVKLPWEENCLAFEDSKNYVRTASVGQVHRKIYQSSIGRIENYLPYLNNDEKKWLC